MWVTLSISVKDIHDEMKMRMRSITGMKSFPHSHFGYPTLLFHSPSPPSLPRRQEHHPRHPPSPASTPLHFLRFLLPPVLSIFHTSTSNLLNHSTQCLQPPQPQHPVPPTSSTTAPSTPPTSSTMAPSTSNLHNTTAPSTPPTSSTMAPSTSNLINHGTQHLQPPQPWHPVFYHIL
ncbi:uncharacterized protein LOC127359768 [Dicentrarchus labrax]|uniref:uncharacterized protein LOC127359768 n=1 Tax=Dicentrarchus labrax TaxID=13489 RepID=UPI0021F55E7E|nr:uncharacterized protein LOC127359768 [Dicentrarchus labrax]